MIEILFSGNSSVEIAVAANSNATFTDHHQLMRNDKEFVDIQTGSLWTFDFDFIYR